MNDKRSDTHAKKNVVSRRAALADNAAVFASMSTRASEQFFARRGLSQATIKALVAWNIAA